jgi:hypothetical protein
MGNIKRFLRSDDNNNNNDDDDDDDDDEKINFNNKDVN